ncbi:uncharacterized protein N7503_007028 [Penicillium pulvis]|uniref:uncharacterized protein n=1 Tax=Penicillium pulvis TaxID=1562058 RepID=UPI0025484E8D|nr:uncharacterized protein N7503_007028 [Penicillium pulvis]KAJ5797732.1 hypothetical protein N7503_007028 [Penicillium pulvis]
MSDNSPRTYDFTLFDFVVSPKLSLDVDWNVWNDSFRIGLALVDERLPCILNGTLKRPSPDMSIDGLVIATSLMCGIQKKFLTIAHVNHFKNNIGPQCLEYDRLCMVGHVLLQKSLSSTALAVVSTSWGFQEVYVVLKNHYAKTNLGRTWILYSLWTTVKFNNGDTPAVFLSRFKLTLRALEIATEKQRPIQIFHQFLTAISGYPNAARFVEMLDIQSCDETTMDYVYAQCMDYNYFQRFESTDTEGG